MSLPDDSANQPNSWFTRTVSAAWLLLAFVVLLGSASEQRFSRLHWPVFFAFHAAAIGLILLAYGWWLRRPWARTWTLIVGWPIALASLVMILLRRMDAMPAAVLVLAVLTLPCLALVLSYLNLRSTKRLFTNTASVRSRFNLRGLMAAVLIASVFMTLFRYFLLDDAYYLVAAVERAKVGDAQGAAQLIRSARSSYYQNRGWREVALGLAEAGDIDAAIEAADLSSKALYEVTLRDIAIKFAQRGEHELFLTRLGAAKGAALEQAVRIRLVEYVEQFKRFGMTPPIVLGPDTDTAVAGVVRIAPTGDGGGAESRYNGAEQDPSEESTARGRR